MFICIKQRTTSLFLFMIEQQVNIYSYVYQKLNNQKFYCNLLSTVTTDGVKNMIGYKIGFMSQLGQYFEKKDINEKSMHFQCIMQACLESF